jgi:hypothetical protein
MSNPRGWVSLGGNDPTRYSQVVPLRRSQGIGQVNQNVRVTTNRSDGNYDVYETNFGAGDRLIYSYNASTNKPIIQNQSLYNQIFAGQNSGQRNTLDLNVRRDTLALAQANVSGGPNSIPNRELIALAQLPGYKSLANAAPTAPTLPGATQPPATPAAGDAAGPQTSTLDAPGPSGASTPLTPEQAAKLVNISRPTIEDYGTIKYPEKFLPGRDYLQIELFEYKKSGLQATAGKFNIARMDDRIQGSPKGTVFLPIQTGIIDNCAVDWGQGDLNPITAQLASVAYGTIGSAGSQGLGAAVGTFGSELARAGETLLKKGGPEVQAMITNFFTQQAVSTPGLLSRTVGGAINNNVELLFNGPTLRSFTFTFRLTPREKKEAESIKKMIRMFKTEMHPSLSPAELFLLAPNIFKLKYFSQNPNLKEFDHPYLNRIKMCALKDFSVSYTPDGSYMTYSENSSMTAYELSMTFAEISPIYKQDYTDSEEGQLGMGW